VIRGKNGNISFSGDVAHYLVLPARHGEDLCLEVSCVVSVQDCNSIIFRVSFFLFSLLLFSFFLPALLSPLFSLVPATVLGGGIPSTLLLLSDDDVKEAIAVHVHSIQLMHVAPGVIDGVLSPSSVSAVAAFGREAYESWGVGRLHRERLNN
jgi:hypothetical protein